MLKLHVHHSRGWFRFALGLSMCGAAAPLGAAERDNSLSDRQPRFLLAAAPVALTLDVARTSVLARRIAVDFRDVSIEDALAVISRRAGLSLMYSKSLVSLDRHVQLVAVDITV